MDSETDTPKRIRVFFIIFSLSFPLKATTVDGVIRGATSQCLLQECRQYYYAGRKDKQGWGIISCLHP
jgi:hypothetical protein